MADLFPLILLEKDSGDLMVFESIYDLQSHVEKIDLENEEYAAWDASGRPVDLRPMQKQVWIDVALSSNERVPSLNEAIRQYSGRHSIELEEKPERAGVDEVKKLLATVQRKSGGHAN